MRRIRTALPLVAAFALAGAVSSPHPAQAPGWTITMRMTIDSGGGRSPTTLSMKLTGSGNKIRQEMTGPGMPPVVSIMDRVDSTMAVVMEQMGMAMIMRMPSEIAGMPAGATNTNLKSTRVDLGPGEPVNGSPTTRHRITLSSTLTQTLGSVSCSRPQTQEIEVWLTNDPVLPKVMAEFMTAMPKLGLPSEDPRELLKRSGLDVGEKAVRVMTKENGSAEGSSVTLTMDFADYALTDVDPAKLAAPAGVQVQDMRGMDMRSMMGGAMGQVGDRIFWANFDTTAAAGAGRATCTRK
jgi:hypothetical protein